MKDFCKNCGQHVTRRMTKNKNGWWSHTSKGRCTNLKVVTYAVLIHKEEKNILKDICKKCGESIEYDMFKKSGYWLHVRNNSPYCDFEVFPWKRAEPANGAVFLYEEKTV